MLGEKKERESNGFIGGASVNIAGSLLIQWGAYQVHQEYIRKEGQEIYCDA